LAGFVLLGGFILMPLVNQLPLLGFDWHRLFYAGFLDQYPPWMIPLFAPFRWIDWRWSLALSNSLSLVGIATLTAIQAPQVRWSGLGAAALALLSPPLWYMLWDGQIDGLIVVGMLVLSLTVMGVGFVLLWQAIPHFLAAFAPFYAWPRRVLGQLGLASSNFERLVEQDYANRRVWTWVFAGTQLMLGAFFLIGAIFLIFKANFSLLTLVLASVS
jgi:hypothetical protein